MPGPLALTARGQGGVRLTAIDRAAAGLGLGVGMSLADARALVPQLIMADAAPEADAGDLAKLTDWCGRYSPWCGTDGADGVRLDITGCAHLFGGEAALLDDAVRRLTGQGFLARGAIADTPAAAWGWARYRPGRASAILASGNDDALRALPAAALRLEAGEVEILRGLGLDRVGAVAALPRAPLTARLGAGVPRRLDLLFGRLDEPISPRALAALWLSRMLFAEPVGRREDLDAATLQLVERLCRELSLKGQGARRLVLGFYRVDATMQQLEIGTSRPTHAPAHIIRLFAERLEQVDPGFGIEAMVLEATETEPLTPTQAALPTTGALDAVDLAALIDRLQNRLGPGRVLQLAPVESHVPERAEMGVPPSVRKSSWRHSFDPLPGESRDPCFSLRGGSQMGPGFHREDEKRKAKPDKRWTPPIKALRPLKLLPVPEPIEATALVPDDPPLFFRWRRVLHRVALADGPERIGPEWWLRAQGRPRDYYRVEDGEGRRFWVYREGLYGAAEPPRWFLHGFFA